MIDVRPSSVAVVLLSLALATPVAALAASSKPRPSFPSKSSATSNPASMVEIAIPSHGARMNGLVYLASGRGPHPVVIFLHGLPGNEKNLDLAQAVRRAGYDAVYFDYRGTWGSGGTFSFQNALEDVGAALAWVRAPENAAKYRFDTRRLALVGHSFGGWLAFMTSDREPSSLCVAGLAAWNVGVAAQRFPSHPDEQKAALDDFRNSTDPEGGPLKASATDLLDAMIAHSTTWDFLSQAATLGDRPLLLVGATNDSPDEDTPMQRRMTRALRKTGARKVTFVTYDDDHPFSSHRPALAAELTQWLRGDCARGQAAR